MWQSYTAKKSCFHDPAAVMEIGDITYYASDLHGINSFDGDLIINLTGRKNWQNLNDIPKELRSHFDGFVPEIVINWDDYGVPAFKSSFWSGLHAYLEDKKYKNVCIHCVGGHGRTGTALSSLLIAVAGYSAIEAVKFIRKNYCKSAVESEEQCTYLAELAAELFGDEFREEDVPKMPVSDAIKKYEKYTIKDLFQDDMPEDPLDSLERFIK